VENKSPFQYSSSSESLETFYQEEKEDIGCQTLSIWKSKLKATKTKTKPKLVKRKK
jgi:hypothetical protein